MVRAIGPLVACLLSLAPLAGARADGFAEGVVGIVAPLGEESYDDYAKTSLKLGARAGGWITESRPDQPGKVGIELAFDWTPFSTSLDNPPNFPTSVHRLRFLGGVRFGVPVGTQALLFFRGLVGVDHVRIDGDVVFGGFRASWNARSTGFALEPGVGVLARVGTVALGAQLAIPVAFHRDDPEERVTLDYDAYDLDFLFTIGTAW
jgi:hypothetical protein